MPALMLTRRSIPACAGEPGAVPGAADEQVVYPRVCGGTSISAPPSHDGQGLSPRVRGNPCYATPRRTRNGSIPACAGEPMTARTVTHSAQVYPRVCGGTKVLGSRTLLGDGLSPRVRGNRDLLHRVLHADGSIPACAGEPVSEIPGRPTFRVYPRVCGGTRRQNRRDLNPSGLSPRVRGNPLAF